MTDTNIDWASEPTATHYGMDSDLFYEAFYAKDESGEGLCKLIDCDDNWSTVVEVPDDMICRPDGV